MEKYVVLSGKEASGSPNIHLFEPGSRYGLGETADLCKTASGEHLPGVLELIESIEPQSDRLYLLNSALGAGEYVGHNMRGDWFPEAGLRHQPSDWDKIAVADIESRRIAANETEPVEGWGDLAWGFPTFMNAHRFRHHINKDPNRAYGYILGSFWDDRMKRVILVSELLRSMCEELGALDMYRRIEGGEFPDTSMGTKVPFDVCDICGNVARTPAEYCKHVSKTASAPYGMGALLPDGRRCGVSNPYPRFFDDSFVFVGAEKSAKVMSNLTEKVRGKKSYSQKLYPFGATTQKAASADAPGAVENILSGAVTSTGVRGSDNYDRGFARLVTRTKEEAGPTADAAADTLTGVLDKLRPSTTEEEKAILKLLSGKPGGNKSASSLKWGEMLKKVPMPGPDERAIIRHHASRVRPFDKKELESFGGDPGATLSKAAEVGIVFSPEEFQFLVLSPFVPKTASALWENGQVFAPVPVRSDDRSVDFCPRSVSDEKLASALGEFFWERSFAPAAVTHRLASDGVLDDQRYKAASFVEYPGSDVLAEIYNDYRGGLLAHAPEWRYATGGPRDLPDLQTEAKLASAARDLSRGLLTLAYWPGLFIG